MKVLRQFDIELVKMKDHVEDTYEFELGDSFFEAMEDSLIQHGKLNATVKATKTSNHVLMHFDIQGTIELICDRSLEPFDYTLHTEPTLMFKYTEQAGEISEEIIGITRDTVKINVAQYLYEYISIEIPIKKLHPKFVAEETDSDEDTLIYSTQTSEEDDIELPGDDPIDPRWLALKSLQDKNKLN
ncbi:MAG: DUF177 domain-containing protein [Cytophagaceae bacterium]